MAQDWEWLNEQSRSFLIDGNYIRDDLSIEERIDEICNTAENYLKIDGYANKLKSYLAKGWISLSSPVWSNFGCNKGLSVSCYGSNIPDTMNGILYKQAEIGMMTKAGGGTSAYIGNIRHRGAPISSGGNSNGSVHFSQLLESTIDVVSQSNFRRGNCAIYTDIDHLDVQIDPKTGKSEFLTIRDDGHPIQNLHYGICISDEWMESMINGDNSKRQIWLEIIKRRYESGEPYIFFKDNANYVNCPEWYKGKISHSNLCSEIFLPDSEDESFVCCLSSLNLLHYDEWVKTDLVETMTFFLDAVMEEFIQKSENMPFMSAAHEFAKNHRALGLGVLGYHSDLQSQQLSFGSIESSMRNAKIFQHIKTKSIGASVKLAEMFGPAPYLQKWYSENPSHTQPIQRNTTTMAIAPTTSSSFILGQVSPSIEPLRSNYFMKSLAKGKFPYRNPELEKILTEEQWQSVLRNEGSVQNLNLDNEIKEVFKTFSEINQYDILNQAAGRQYHIDQGQSINLMIPHDTPYKQTSDLMIHAYRLGLKSLYYQHSTSPVQQLRSTVLQSCSACEG